MAATPDVASISRGIAFSLMGYPAGLQPLAEKTNALLPQLLASAQLSGMVMAITVDFPTEEVGRIQRRQPSSCREWGPEVLLSFF